MKIKILNFNSKELVFNDIVKNKLIVKNYFFNGVVKI